MVINKILKFLEDSIHVIKIDVKKGISQRR